MIDPPTIGERYSSATESSDLRVRADRQGDVDLMIASGWITEGLGTSIYRLRTEFDAVKATDRPGVPMALGRLRSLPRAVEVVGTHAWQMADAHGLRNSIDVERVAHRVLDVFLDPLCCHCDGRGFNGGTHRGEPQVLCRPCRGSGQRRDQVGRSDVERVFAVQLLAQLERTLAEVDRKMTAFLRSRYGPLVMDRTA